MLFVFALACVHFGGMERIDAELGSTGLSSATSNGIGGLIGNRGAGPYGPDPQEEQGWARFRETDAAYAALLGMPGPRWGAESRELSVRVQAQEALVVQLVDVLDVGAGRPGIAALVRIGQVYDDTQRWLDADPIVPPRYTTPTYRFVYPLLAPFGAAPPYPPSPDEGFVGAGCVAYPYRERPIAVYEAALDKAYELSLHDEPAVRIALERLRVLDPEEYPERWERIPGDPMPFEEAL